MAQSWGESPSEFVDGGRAIISEDMEVVRIRYSEPGPLESLGQRASDLREWQGFGSIELTEDLP